MNRGVVALAMWVGTGCADEGPRLVSVEPAAAPRRAHVMLVGEGLCGESCAAAAGAVRIGDGADVVQATIVAFDETRAELAIPEITPVGPTKLILTVNEVASNALDFEVLP